MQQTGFDITQCHLPSSLSVLLINLCAHEMLIPSTDPFILSFLSCPSIHPYIGLFTRTRCNKQMCHRNTAQRYIVTNKIYCSPALAHFIEVTTLTKMNRVPGTCFMIQPSSVCVCLMLVAGFVALTLDTTALSREAGHYKMFVIQPDKSMGSALKSNVDYWRETRPHIEAVFSHREQRRESGTTINALLAPAPPFGGQDCKAVAASQAIPFSGKLYLQLINSKIWSSSYYFQPSKYLSEIHSIYLNHL